MPPTPTTAAAAAPVAYLAVSSRKGARLGAGRTEYSRPSMMVNSDSAPAWCAAPRLTGT